MAVLPCPPIQYQVPCPRSQVVKTQQGLYTHYLWTIYVDVIMCVCVYSVYIHTLRNIKINGSRKKKRGELK